jgi:serine/threonine protein kinase
MLAGRPLFETSGSTFAEPPPSPAKVRSDCPPELERIVLRALAYDPAQRYQTARALQRDLEELAREQRLAQSSSALADHMHALFPSEIRSWRPPETSVVTSPDMAPWNGAPIGDEPEEPTRTFDAEDATVQAATRVAAAPPPPRVPNAPEEGSRVVTRVYRTTRRLDREQPRPPLLGLALLIVLLTAALVRPLIAKDRSSAPAMPSGTSAPTMKIGTSVPGAMIGTSVPGAMIGTSAPGAKIGTSAPGAKIGTSAPTAKSHVRTRAP